MRHILGGFDHLLFVFGLMLLVSSRRMLLEAITAFTVAHIPDLGRSDVRLDPHSGAAAERSHCAVDPLLGVEVISHSVATPASPSPSPGRGLCLRPAPRPRFRQWPQPDRPASVRYPAGPRPFNIGVELGQLLFVGVMLMVVFSLGQLRIRGPEFVMRAPTYLVGCLGSLLDDRSDCGARSWMRCTCMSDLSRQRRAKAADKWASATAQANSADSADRHGAHACCR